VTQLRSSALHQVLASTLQLKCLQEEEVAKQVASRGPRSKTQVLAYQYYLQVLASQVLDVRHWLPVITLYYCHNAGGQLL
jgi:hypothetical protein